MSVSSSPTPLEQLAQPPVVEVVCGVKFQPLGIDPLLLGLYWQERRADYPVRQLQEALQDANELVWSTTPLVRSWFVDASGAFLLQFQHDRFYLNWRRGAQGGYPRFSDRDGREGVLSRALAEFDRFGAFCEREVGARPRPVRCELAKIDHFVEHTHWEDLRDLALMLPWFGAFVGFAKSSAPSMAMQFAEKRTEGELVVSLAAPVQTTANAARVVTMETRVMTNVSEDTALRDVFSAANNETNAVFARIIPAEQRHRFQLGGTR